MKKIILNDKNLVPDSNWLNFRKVRAIIENDEGKIVISKEGGIYIFPGGKCDGNEKEETAIIREIKEETGINITDEALENVLVIESFYDDFWDYRSESLKPRHTLTTYFYIKTDKKINTDKLKLTEVEKKLGFDIFTTGKNNLYKLLNEAHSDSKNEKFFVQENKIVLEEIINKMKH